ncbi:MAG: carbamoyltransferase HypF [Acidobacteriia bacterium]|nr:carbamoyltransferase HypF [Terriglobia bacterium]
MRKRLEVRGTVQGVGFRPFVYRLATSLSLAGYVLNESGGVTIEIEGAEIAITSFVRRLRSEAPPLASIETLDVHDLASCGEREFAIHHSVADESKFAMVPPDIATCDECGVDYHDPANRRYLYPFTNCTNCGPRYTIIQDIPYDRPKTTMSVFPMCSQCQAEYDDPGNRRFHAQPNACPVCGPSLVLSAAAGGPAAGVSPGSTLAQVRQLLKSGKIVAIKGLGGFHLACDAENDAAVRLLRGRKRRSDKAFALMIRDLAVVEQFAIVTGADKAALTNPRRPIVLMPRREGTTISDAVAPGNRNIGVMLPYTPLHDLLFEDGIRALVMTSGNLSEEPIVSRNEDAGKLAGLADHFLLHNRDIQTRVDDSVVRCFEDRPRMIRRSRGYAPEPIELGHDAAEVLATGGELKNTFCLTKGAYAILSQHIGDLENLETLEFFEETLGHMKRFFRVEPRAVAYDLHPGYLSTKFALKMDLPKIGVQHHHAHIASCMAENHVREKVLGVAFDGTGYGTDGKIWGGEFLLADYKNFDRIAHFKYVPMAGGDAAVREPWRIALGYLREAFGSTLPDLPMLARVDEKKIRFVQTATEKRINTVDTSSCGRLFDAVSAICDVRLEANYEGQAAIELENRAAAGIDDAYALELEAGEIDTRPLIRAIAGDLLRGAEVALISAKFHNAVARVIVEVARSAGLKRVALSGGTFQNFYLLTRSVALLRQAGFEVLLHSTVPANDGGLSLGQAVIAGEKLK